MGTAGSSTFNATTGNPGLVPGVGGSKGSIVELISSTPAAAKSGIITIAGNHGSNMNAQAYDLMLGGVGVETVFLPDITYSSKIGPLIIGSSLLQFYFAKNIPIGSRVSARMSSDEDREGTFGITLLEGGEGYTSHEEIGTVSDSEGQVVDPGTVANQYGSWQEFSSAVTNTIKGLICLFNVGNNGNIGADYHHTIQVGVGSLNNEVPINGANNIPLFYDTSESVRGGACFTRCDIPSGERVSVRTQCSNVGDANDRTIHGRLIGLY